MGEVVQFHCLRSGARDHVQVHVLVVDCVDFCRQFGAHPPAAEEVAEARAAWCLGAQRREQVLALRSLLEEGGRLVLLKVREALLGGVEVRQFAHAHLILAQATRAPRAEPWETRLRPESRARRHRQTVWICATAPSRLRRGLPARALRSCLVTDVEPQDPGHGDFRPRSAQWSSQWPS